MKFQNRSFVCTMDLSILWLEWFYGFLFQKKKKKSSIIIK